MSDTAQYNAKRFQDETDKQCIGASRERLEYLIRRQADNLVRESDRLYNLAKAIELLPNELENLLYPLVIDSLYKGNRI